MTENLSAFLKVVFINQGVICTGFILRTMHICPDDRKVHNSGDLIWCMVYWTYFKNLIVIYLKKVDNIVPVVQSWHSNVEW